MSFSRTKFQNVVTITAWGDALLDVVNEFGTAINTYAATGQRLDSVRLGRLSNFLSRIDLVPDFQTQYETMVNLIDQTKNMTVVDQPGVDNFTVLEYQYLLQIVVSSAQVRISPATGVSQLTGRVPLWISQRTYGATTTCS